MLDGLSKVFCFISILPVPLISSLQKNACIYDVGCWCVYMEAREQLSGAEFLPSIIWAGRVNSGGQALWQVPLTTEPSYWALTSIHFCFAVTPVFFHPSPSKPLPLLPLSVLFPLLCFLLSPLCLFWRKWPLPSTGCPAYKPPSHRCPWIPTRPSWSVT